MSDTDEFQQIIDGVAAIPSPEQVVRLWALREAESLAPSALIETKVKVAAFILTGDYKVPEGTEREDSK